MQKVKLAPRKLIAICHLICDKEPSKEVFNAYYDIATDYTNVSQDNIWSFVCGERREKMLQAQREYKRRMRRNVKEINWRNGEEKAVYTPLKRSRNWK